MSRHPTQLSIAALAFCASACGTGEPPDLTGDWRVQQIEWTQDDRRVRLTADGEMHMGRLKLPQRPGSFEPMFQAMQHVTVRLETSGRDFTGSVHAGDQTPPALLRQIGAQPGSVIAEFEGSLVNDTLGSALVTATNGREREVVFRIQDRGRRVIARAIPVFGESDRQASDVVLVPLGDRH
jgi:hypothetical protein